jgi:hypothetical protein
MPRKRIWFSSAVVAVGLICIVAMAFLSYELGRYQAGYSLLDVRRTNEARDAEIATRNGQIDDLERQIAILETAREIDRETYAQVEANLNQLEAQLQAQQEELAFYQGIVSPDDGAAGLRVQTFEIESRRAERAFLLKLVLIQAIVHNQNVRGSVNLTVVGHSGGVRTTFDVLDLVVGDDSPSTRYSFRYFQALEYEIELPLGFVAESVELVITPTEPKGSEVIQTYAWPE